MNQEVYANAVANAETARALENYPLALEWIRKALDENPDDISALTKAGAICIPMDKLEESQEYFQKAAELEPANGDHLFQLGNLCFLKNDFSQAMQYYAEAEIKGCSEEITPNLYYQTALVCSICQDFKAALLNFQKYENTEKTKLAALHPDVISEKIKLYMMLEDYKNAAKYAAQLVAMSPSEFRNYMVYFNLLVIQKDYQTAFRVLEEATAYAEKKASNYFEIETEKINLYLAAADDYPQNREHYYQQAYDLIRTLFQYPEADRQELTLQYAEICLKMQRYQEALRAALPLLSDSAPAISPVPAHKPLTQEEAETMLEQDMQLMESKINSQELPDSLGELHYDAEGNEIRIFPEGAFDALNTDLQNHLENPGIPASAPKKDPAFYDRLHYLLLSCYAAGQAYAECATLATHLKHSQNSEYADFAWYQEAVSAGHLPEKFTPEQAEECKAKALSYFRNRMMRGENRYPAIRYRSRLYAESGKFAKAEEMAGLLNAQDKQEALQYIAECRKSAESEVQPS